VKRATPTTEGYEANNFIINFRIKEDIRLIFNIIKVQPNSI